MLLANVADTHWNGLEVVAESSPEHDRKDRIAVALGPLGEQSPRVDEETLSRYYKYLSARSVIPVHRSLPRAKVVA